MPDYSKGKIYIIRSPHTEEVYIGSTISTLSKRMGQHREKFNKWKKGEHHYFTCFKLIDLGDAYIELIEEYPCENKNQLERREGEIMRATSNCINKQIAGRTYKEWYLDNQEIWKSKVNEYRLNNQEKIKLRKNEYYQKNKERLKEISNQRYYNNRDKIREKQNKRRQAKKEAEINIH